MNRRQMDQWWAENMLGMERPRSRLEREWMAISGIPEEEYIDAEFEVVTNDDDSSSPCLLGISCDSARRRC